MCSAGARDADDATNGRSRIIDAAIDLIGEEGVKATTVRRVAASAGVSAPLVLHHFGSKGGLVRACDDEVIGRIEHLLAAMHESGAEGAIHQMLATDGMASSMVYVARSLHDDGDVGRQWFERLYDMTRTGMDDMARSGVMRPVADPSMVASLLLAMDLGMVLLRPHVERALTADLTEPHTAERWIRAEFDLFTHALLRADAPATEPE